MSNVVTDCSIIILFRVQEGGKQVFSTYRLLSPKSEVLSPKCKVRTFGSPMRSSLIFDVSQAGATVATSSSGSF